MTDFAEAKFIQYIYSAIIITLHLEYLNCIVAFIICHSFTLIDTTGMVQ